MRHPRAASPSTTAAASPLPREEGEGAAAVRPPVWTGAPRTGDGDRFAVRAPHRHDVVLGEARQATGDDVGAAVDAALAAAPAWAATPQRSRSAILLRAAELLSGPWRDRLNAATMLG